MLCQVRDPITFITPSPYNACLPCWSHNKPPPTTLQVLGSVPCDLLPPSCPQSGPYHTSSSNQPLKSWVVSHSVYSSTNASKETTIGYDTLSILAKTWDNSGGSKEIYLQYLLPAKGKSLPAPCFCLRVMFSWSKRLPIPAKEGHPRSGHLGAMLHRLHGRSLLQAPRMFIRHWVIHACVTFSAYPSATDGPAGLFLSKTSTK